MNVRRAARGSATAGSRYIAAVATAVALLHLAALFVAPSGLELPLLLGLEGFTLAVLLALTYWFGAGLEGLGTLVACVAIALLATLALLATVDSLPVAAGLLLGGGLLLSYLLHRVELVALGLVEVPGDE